MGVESAISGALKTFLRVFGKDVIYRSGAQFIALRAAPDLPRYPAEQNPQGLVFAPVDRDWVCFAAELKFGSTVHRPRRGDRIEVTATGDVYEILPRDGDQCYGLEGSDLALRIHCKRITN